LKLVQNEYIALHHLHGTFRLVSQGYEGDFQWVIELEKGWSPWMPGNEPYYGATDAPLKYTLGRYDFEALVEEQET